MERKTNRNDSPPHGTPWGLTLSVRDLGKTLLILLLATLIGWLFYLLGFTEANIITAYLLAVLITSMVTSGWVCSLIASIISVFIFNYLFTNPRFTFRVYDKGYPVTFAIMFLAAMLTGTLAGKLRDHAGEAARSAFRSQVLFETSQLLQKAPTQADILPGIGGQLARLLNRPVRVCPAGSSPEDGRLFWPEGQAGTWPVTEEDCTALGAVLIWCPRKETSDAICLPIRSGDRVYGAVAIRTAGDALKGFESSMVLSVLGECALAMDNKRIAREKEQSALLAQSEQLRANLLRSISHDLRTPLTSISGNASNLMSNGASIDEEAKQQIYTDIYDDAMWLISLVENLLAVTRLEDGKMQLHTSTELVDEIVAEALRHVDRRASEHTITVEASEDLLLVKGDSKLIIQVIMNLVDNAVKYTPPGSHIRIRAQAAGDRVELSVADDGPGIPDEQKPKIFDMFYTGSNRLGDSRRSLGLGLGLCRSIAAAHGGTLTVADNTPHGAVFSFTLPRGEVTMHE